MNNPFLSDRNIFSKVVNPLRKKEEKKPEERPSQPIRTVEKPKEPLTDSNPYKNDRMQANPQPKQNPFVANQKLSFGPPSEPAPIPKPKTYAFSHSQSQEEESETQVYSYGKRDVQIVRGVDRAEVGRWDDKKGFERERAVRQEVLSPPQEHRFEQFRKNNNLEDYSPINPPRMGDSQFLNIDAMGDDINKFLAESKNQEELCKILGIERKKDQPRKTEVARFSDQRPVGRDFSEKGQNSRGFNELLGSKTEEFGKPVWREGVQDSQHNMPRVPAIFSKDRKVENARTEQQQVPRQQEKPIVRQEVSIARQQQQLSMRNQEQPMKNSNDHVPTFNFGTYDQEHSTLSREEGEKQEKEGAGLQVFSYGQAKGGQEAQSLESLIEKEMLGLSISGRYRTFLSASEKVVTVRYRMEPL